VTAATTRLPDPLAAVATVINEVPSRTLVVKLASSGFGEGSGSGVADWGANRVGQCSRGFPGGFRCP